MKAFFLLGFKDTVKRATKSRLAGKMEQACSSDSAIELYYQNRKEHGYSEDFLFEIESDIRSDG